MDNNKYQILRPSPNNPAALPLLSLKANNVAKNTLQVGIKAMKAWDYPASLNRISNFLYADNGGGSGVDDDR